MQPSPESSSLAWFKLAELVVRREKERALSIYRLLSYAWRDNAYSLQLEGDLLSAFQDYERACKSYEAAASLYHTSQRYIQAAFLYETVLLYHANHNEIRRSIIYLFAQSGIREKVIFHMQLFLHSVFFDQHEELFTELLVQASQNSKALELTVEAALSQLLYYKNFLPEETILLFFEKNVQPIAQEHQFLFNSLKNFNFYLTQAKLGKSN